MKKQLLKIMFITIAIVCYGDLNAQVVSSLFGSDNASDGPAEWTDGATFAQFFLESTATDAKLKTRSNSTIGTMTYSGTYSGTLSTTDVIYLRIRHVDTDVTGPDLTRAVVSYTQNGGGVETQTLTIDNSISTEQELIVTPGFTNGATLADLVVTYTDDSGANASDVLRLLEFVIGPNPTLSTNSKVIEGAKVYANEGSVLVKGANLDQVFSITGQEVGATNLSHGIYIVKISKNNKFATVKIVL